MRFVSTLFGHFMLKKLINARCESYNTAQIRLLHGDMSEALEEEDGDEGLPYRPRSSPFHGHEGSMSSLEAFRMNTNSVPNSHARTPLSAGAEGHIASYNLAHGRAISPVVSNYFGLPSERESVKPSSLPFFGGRPRSDETEHGPLSYLSNKLRYRYGFLGGDSKSTGEVPEGDSEDDAESSDAGTDAGHEDEDAEDEDDEEEEDDVEYIDIFGHR